MTSITSFRLSSSRSALAHTHCLIKHVKIGRSIGQKGQRSSESFSKILLTPSFSGFATLTSKSSWCLTLEMSILFLGEKKSYFGLPNFARNITTFIFLLLAAMRLIYESILEEI